MTDSMGLDDAEGTMPGKRQPGSSPSGSRNQARRQSLSYSLQGVIDSIQSPVFSLDRNYCYTCYNTTHAAQMKVFYGIDIHDGLNFIECMPEGDDRELARKNLGKVMLTGQTLVEESFSIGVDSRRYYFEVIHSPIKDPGGVISGISIVARDITETKDISEKMLRQRDEYRTIIDSVPSMIVVVDREGKVVRANISAASCLGRTPKELIGKKVQELFGPQMSGLMLEHCRHVLSTGQPVRGIIGKFPLPGTLPVYLDTDLLPYKNKDGTVRGVLVVSTDVTDRQKTMDRLMTTTRVFGLLSEMNQAIVRHGNREDLFHALCTIAVRTGGFRMAWIGLCDEQSGHVIPVAHYGFEDGYLSTLPQGNDPITERTLSAATAVHEGKVTVIEDIKKDIRMEEWRQEALKRGYRSLASIPLKPGGKFTGNFVIYSDITDYFSYKEVNLLEQIGADISFALEKLDIEEKRLSSQNELKLLAALLNHANDGILVFDSNMKAIYVNQTNLDLYGYTREEFMAGHPWKIVTSEYAENEEKITKALEKKGEISYTTEHYRKDGSVLPLEVHARKLEIEGNQYVIGIGIDITQRRKAEQELRFRSQILNAANDTIFVWDSNDKCIYVNDAACRSSGYTREELLGKHVRDLVSEPGYKLIEKDINKRLSTDGEAVFEISQISKDRAEAPYEVHSRIIKLGGQIYKVSIARDIAERKLYEDKLKSSYERIERTFNGITQAISATVKLRDPYTADHQMRVARLAQAIAEEMSLGEEKSGQIYTAGLIHDIGKLSLPAEILSKPGKLNDLEFSLIKTHPQAGSDILKKIDFTYPLAKWVLEHHERINGSGYPAKLSDGQISLESKILAVADVVEAMFSHRPYRASLGIEAAIEEIRRHRKMLYDESAVDACVRLFANKGFKF